MGSLPVLTLSDGTRITQSDAIARWAAKKAGNAPADPDDALLSDELSNTAFDMLNKCPQDADEEVKKEKRQEFAAGFLTQACNLVCERLAIKDGPLLLGTELCLGDLNLLMVSQMILDGHFDHVPASFLDAFPAILEHAKAVKETEIVKAYAAFDPTFKI